MINEKLNLNEIPPPYLVGIILIVAVVVIWLGLSISHNKSKKKDLNLMFIFLFSDPDGITWKNGGIILTFITGSLIFIVCYCYKPVVDYFKQKFADEYDPAHPKNLGRS